MTARHCKNGVLEKASLVLVIVSPLVRISIVKTTSEKIGQ